MWMNVYEDPIPTYGKHGKEFKLKLKFANHYYGHNIMQNSVVVVCAWDSICEDFFEVNTGKRIDARDITHWWKDE